MNLYLKLKIEEDKLKQMAEKRYQNGLPLTDKELLMQKEIVDNLLFAISKETK